MSKSRLEAFSDGVIAIIITILLTMKSLTFIMISIIYFL